MVHTISFEPRSFVFVSVEEKHRQRKTAGNSDVAALVLADTVAAAFQADAFLAPQPLATRRRRRRRSVGESRAVEREVQRLHRTVGNEGLLRLPIAATRRWPWRRSAGGRGPVQRQLGQRRMVASMRGLLGRDGSHTLRRTIGVAVERHPRRIRLAVRRTRWPDGLDGPVRDKVLLRPRLGTSPRSSGTACTPRRRHLNLLRALPGLGEHVLPRQGLPS
mmetsp:Transcript_96790/g.273497  ORF Transcript_96790/g.273497 Transcript_96790/m.273497 type:complete len:219 (+) Transcript_96790:586-1242(+)